MWYNLLATVADKTRVVSVGESAILALLGFAIVFVGIAFLILVVWAIGKVMTKVQAPKKTQKVEPVQHEKPVVKDEEISEETVAILTAAIMAYYEQTNAQCEFKVKRIKRI